MAFTGLIVTCGYAGNDGANRGHSPVFGMPVWSESPNTGTATTNAAPTNNDLPAIFRVYAAADSYISVGPAPDSTQDSAANPRILLKAATAEYIYVKPGWKLMWQAA